MIKVNYGEYWLATTEAEARLLFTKMGEAGLQWCTGDKIEVSESEYADFRGFLRHVRESNGGVLFFDSGNATTPKATYGSKDYFGDKEYHRVGKAAGGANAMARRMFRSPNQVKTSFRKKK